MTQLSDISPKVGLVAGGWNSTFASLYFHITNPQKNNNMKLNKTVLMGLITLATLSFSACGDSKKTDAAAPAPSEASATKGTVIRVLDGNGTPIATAGITIVITGPNNNVIKLKTAADGTVALPTDKVTYPAIFTAESEGHTYTKNHVGKASDIYGNKVVIIQD